jgi:hypothetical protein
MIIATMATAAAKKDKKPPAKWTIELKKTMLEVLLDQPTIADNGYKTQEWSAMHQEFNRRIAETHPGQTFDLAQMQSINSTMKSEIKTFINLRDLSGFGWDSEKLIPTAPEKTWEDYLLNNPKCAKYKTESIPNFQLLVDVHGGKIATGNHSSASVSTFSTPKFVTQKKRSLFESGSESDVSTNAGDPYQSNDESEEPRQSKPRLDEGKGTGIGIAFSTDKKTVLPPRMKTAKPVDKALLILEDIRTMNKAQVSKPSFLKQANAALNDEFENLSGKEKVFIKELFQVDSCAEMFVDFSEDEKIIWVMSKLEP